MIRLIKWLKGLLNIGPLTAEEARVRAEKSLAKKKIKGLKAVNKMVMSDIKKAVSEGKSYVCVSNYEIGVADFIHREYFDKHSEYYESMGYTLVRFHGQVVEIKWSEIVK